jgi:sigma-B regulation protein RsbQ
VDVLTKNNVSITGAPEGQPMIFAPGYGCDQTMWRFVAPAFEDRYRIVLFDHAGTGGADVAAYDPARYASLAGYTHDVLAICEELALPPAIFVGHSVSSMIGALAAIEQPERFERLIMIGPSPRYIDDDGYRGGFSAADIDELLDSLDSNYLGWSGAIAPVIMGNPDRPELGAELTESFCRNDPEIARRFAHVTFTSDNREDLSEVRTPTLVVQCDQDAIAPQEVGEYVHGALPHSEMVVLRATGHCPHMSAPDETIAAMEAFLTDRR